MDTTRPAPRGKRSGARNDATPRIRAVPAVTRAIGILRLLGRSRTPLTAKAIAQSLELVPSTCLHILRALLAERLVQVDPGTKRYSLGSGLVPLARAALATGSFSTLVQPELDGLTERYAVTAIGVEIVGLDHMIVLALSRSQAPMRLHVDIGSRFPALISATGRCVAAFGGHPWDEVERRFRALRWQSPPPFEAWRRDVETVRRRGYSIDRGNYIGGVAIIAVPVLARDGTISHAIIGIGLVDQVDHATAVAMAHDMRRAAQAIATQMG